MLTLPSHLLAILVLSLSITASITSSQHRLAATDIDTESSQANPILRLLRQPDAAAASRLARSEEQHHYSNTVLLVRHGEKDSDGSVGLNEVGKKRAKCFRKIFGRHSRHDIGLILAEEYDRETGRRKRPFDTVKGLGKDLGIEINTDCEVEDAECVRKVIAKFSKHSKKDVMICWKHSQLNVIAQALGAKASKSYPDDRFDIVWTLVNQRIVSKHSEECPGIDFYRQPPDLDLEIESEDVDYYANLDREEISERHVGGQLILSEEWRQNDGEVVSV